MLKLVALSLILPGGVAILASQTVQEVQVLPCRRGEFRQPISMLPFTITQCGSYVVTRCLTGSAGSHGITVLADNVTIDLNGFSLTGVPGSIDGVNASGLRNVRIENGVLEKWGSDGVDGSTSIGCQFASLCLSQNFNDGINGGIASTIRDCIAIDNRNGIRARESSSVLGSIAYSNADDGFHSGEPAVFGACAADDNDQAGFDVANSHIAESISTGPTAYSLNGGSTTSDSHP